MPISHSQQVKATLKTNKKHTKKEKNKSREKHLLKAVLKLCLRIEWLLAKHEAIAVTFDPQPTPGVTPRKVKGGQRESSTSD